MAGAKLAGELKRSDDVQPGGRTAEDTLPLASRRAIARASSSSMARASS
jgi:hypothetical protein